MGSTSSKPVKSTPKDVDRLLLWCLSEQIRWSDQCHSAQQVLSLSSSELPSSIPFIHRGEIESQLNDLLSSGDHSLRLVDDIIGGGRDTLNIGKTKGEVNSIGKMEAGKKEEIAEANPINEGLASKGFAEAATKAVGMEAAGGGKGGMEMGMGNEMGADMTPPAVVPSSTMDSSMGPASSSSSSTSSTTAAVGSSSPLMTSHQLEGGHRQYPAHHLSSSSLTSSSPGLESVIHIVPTATRTGFPSDPTYSGDAPQQPMQQQQQSPPLSSTFPSSSIPPSNAASVSSSPVTLSSRLQQERLEIASKFLFIHSLLERLVRSAESNYQLKCKLEFLRKRLKPKRSYLLENEEEKMRLQEELDSLHSLFAVQLESFDRARDSLQWLIRDYSFSFALHKLHLEQHQTQRFKDELVREKQQEGAGSLDELGKMKAGLSSMTKEEAKEAGYTKKEIEQASKAPEAPTSVPVVAPSSSSPSPLSSSPFSTSTLASSSHHPLSHSHSHPQQGHDHRLNRLDDLLSRLEEKELRLHSAMLANEKQSLSLGLAFLDHNYNGSIDTQQLPSSSKIHAILDPTKTGTIGKNKLEATVEEVGKRMEKREKEIEKLGYKVGSGRTKNEEGVNGVMTRIEELKTENEEDRSLLRDIYQFFLNSFLSHVFTQIEQTNQTRFNPKSVDVNLLFREMRLIEGDVAQSMVQDPLAVSSSSFSKEEEATRTENEAELGSVSREVDDERRKAHSIETARSYSPLQQQIGSGRKSETFERAPNDYAPAKDVELKNREAGSGAGGLGGKQGSSNEKEKERTDYEKERATGGMGMGGSDHAFMSDQIRPYSAGPAASTDLDDGTHQSSTLSTPPPPPPSSSHLLPGPPTSTPTPTTSPHPFVASSSDLDARREESQSRLDRVVEVGDGEMMEPKQKSSLATAANSSGLVGFNKEETGSVRTDPKETPKYDAAERRA